MEKNLTLVIMAAGMGSRYGGLKQIDPVDEYGNIIIDYSIYDAIAAGFDKVVFIIQSHMEKEFKEVIGDRISRQVEVAYAYQALDKLPEGFSLPENRVKPWGTGHAVLCASEAISGPFAVINADDYYGREAFQAIAKKLNELADDENTFHYTMVGYQLYNTLTDNGHVSRGICQTDENGMLTDIQERTWIERLGEGAGYSEDEGKTFEALGEDTIVSMNMWGFTPSYLKELAVRFPEFLKTKIPENPLKCEYFLPSVVDELVKEKKADVAVLPCESRWYGVTYKEDKETVVQAIKDLKKQGVYPETLWV